MDYWLKEQDAIDKRFIALQDMIADYERHNLPHHELSYEWWREYEKNGTLPFSGGYAEQPQWWHDDVAYFRTLKALKQLPHEARRIDEQITSIRERM